MFPICYIWLRKCFIWHVMGLIFTSFLSNLVLTLCVFSFSVEIWETEKVFWLLIMLPKLPPEACQDNDWQCDKGGLKHLFICRIDAQNWVLLLFIRFYISVARFLLTLRTKTHVWFLLRTSCFLSFVANSY